MLSFFEKALWKKWSGYHRRSFVETMMHCIKLLGDKLTVRSFPKFEYIRLILTLKSLCNEAFQHVKILEISAKQI